MSQFQDLGILAIPHLSGQRDQARGGNERRGAMREDHSIPRAYQIPIPRSRYSIHRSLIYVICGKGDHRKGPFNTTDTSDPHCRTYFVVFT